MDRKTIELQIKTPKDFDFHRTVYSHGWCSLLPFSVSQEPETLSFIATLPDATTVRISVHAPTRSTLRIALNGNVSLDTNQQAAAIEVLRAVLRLEEDLKEFHRHVSKHRKYRWIAGVRAGRMLRAPTVFEDVVKMMCTTNCSWALTTTMVTNLVELLGVPAGGAGRAFPLPAAIAGQTDAFMRKNIRCGYRAPFLLSFAENAASGKIDLESLRHSTAPTAELFDHLRSIKGIGEYSAGNLLRLLGRYDYLGLDSWVRGRYYEIYHKGRKVSDATIERRYRDHAEWRGLVFWLEMTRHWFGRKFPF